MMPDMVSTMRQKRFNEAFSSTGTTEFPVVICYDSIFVRDHWNKITDVPWWYRDSGIVEYELAWVTDFIERTNLDWIRVRPSPPRETRERLLFEVRDTGVFQIDTISGQETPLSAPVVGGKNSAAGVYRKADVEIPADSNEADVSVHIPPQLDMDTFIAGGRADLSREIGNQIDVIRYIAIAGPIWSFYSRYGYEGMMLFLARDPDLAKRVAERIAESSLNNLRIAQALGADAIWIEDCLTDQIHPDQFAAINVPLLQLYVRTIRSLGMKSVYYYCGNPFDRIDHILRIGADAYHFEESKKHFTIDINEVVGRINGGAAVFGNLDSIGVLQDGSDADLAREIDRQLEAGTRNGNRFIMSIGSPVTPHTSVDRVRDYSRLAHMFTPH
jgi:hypothetical protein